ncbi:hypothetical protein ACO1O0_008650 [Amphichorda felina]
MCRSEESYHQYSGCRLIQTVSAPSIHSDQDETEQKPETGVFIIFSEFIRRYASNLQNAGEGSSDEKDDAIQDYPEPHTVKVIFIIQCETAEINESLHPDRLKRRCRELRSLEEQRDSVMEERPRLTTMNTACPVCEAIERAEQQALVQEKIVSLDPSIGACLGIYPLLKPLFFKHPRNSTMLKPPEPRRPSNNGRRGVSHTVSIWRAVSDVDWLGRIKKESLPGQQLRRGTGPKTKQGKLHQEEGQE